MTRRQNNDAKSRAEAVFRKPAATAPTASGNEETSVSADNEPTSSSRPVETTEGAMDEYKARQDAQRANMVKLRTQRLAKEGHNKPKPARVKQKR